MARKIINIGFGNIVLVNKIVAITSPDSSPIRRIIQEAKNRNMLINATYGRKTKSVIIVDSDKVILTSISPESLNSRL